MPLRWPSCRVQASDPSVLSTKQQRQESQERALALASRVVVCALASRPAPPPHHQPGTARGAPDRLHFSSSPAVIAPPAAAAHPGVPPPSQPREAPLQRPRPWHRRARRAIASWTSPTPTCTAWRAWSCDPTCRRACVRAWREGGLQARRQLGRRRRAPATRPQRSRTANRPPPPPSAQALDLTANRLRALEPVLLALQGLQRLSLRQNLLADAAEVEHLASAPGALEPPCWPARPPACHALWHAPCCPAACWAASRHSLAAVRLSRTHAPLAPSLSLSSLSLSLQPWRNWSCVTTSWRRCLPWLASPRCARSS